jgi:hypothetical protein
VHGYQLLGTVRDFQNATLLCLSDAYIYWPLFDYLQCAGKCEFSKLYFLPQFVFILLGTFVHTPSLVLPCILSREQQPDTLADT